MQKTENGPADTDYVVSAANYLEKSEYEIFRDAYTAWYGREVSEKQAGKIFVQYLLENKVPFWVRNYARARIPDNSTLKKDQTGEFSSAANNLLYLATIILEYALLASYLVLR